MGGHGGMDNKQEVIGGLAVSGRARYNLVNEER